MITKETNENEPVVGIIGGMGPEATVDLMARIIRATPAADDADHIRMLVDNNPKIPSRLKAIVERSGPSPVPVLIDMARQLAAWGADLLVIPCNTAHFYRDAIAAAVKVPVLDMIALAADRTTAMVPAGAPVGLLAADGALQTGLYQRAFGARDRRLLIPAPSEQARLMAVIRAIKTGPPGDPAGGMH